MNSFDGVGDVDTRSVASRALNGDFRVAHSQGAGHLPRGAITEQHRLDSCNVQETVAFEGKSTCLVSLCLIVKNEENMLASCLASAVGLTDEVVVYDTGSSDRTVAIARDAGARVVEGYWDDSFARARNASLAHAHGEWVVTLDADELFEGDAPALRHLLETSGPTLEGYLVTIENLAGAGTPSSIHTATRIFRRTSGVWRHRLHEQVVAREDSERGLRVGFLSTARIIHRGYDPSVVDVTKKAERNLLLARAVLDDEGENPSYVLMNYGRSLAMAGQREEAVSLLQRAAAVADRLVVQQMSVRNVIELLGALGRFEEALNEVDHLRRISSCPIAADIAEARTRLAMGDDHGALVVMARVPPRGRDDEGIEYSAHTIADLRSAVLVSLGRHHEAADTVLDAVRREGLCDIDVGGLVSWLATARRPPSHLVDVIEGPDLLAFLGQVVRLSPLVADEILEARWFKHSDELESLAAAAKVAPRLSVARALVWSSRLRARGLNSACPLVAMVNDERLDPRVRIFAAAAAYGSFTECAVVEGLHQARHLLSPLDVATSNEEIRRLAPGLLDAVHVTSTHHAVPDVDATTASRAARQSARKRSLMVLAPQPRPGGVNIVGPFESTSLEGDVARIVATALRSRGVAVSTTSYHADGRNGTRPWDHRDEGDQPFETTLLVMSPDDLVSYVLDNGAGPFGGRYCIGVWLWDFERSSSKLTAPALMVREIWTPSRFAAAALSEISTRPVVRISLPVGTDFAHDRGAHEGEGFHFVTSVDFARGFERQNPLGVVQAFRTAFAPGKGARLVIEAAHWERSPQQYATLCDAVSDREDIELVLDPEGVGGRVFAGRTTGDACFVSLHRSEGTGLVLARHGRRNTDDRDGTLHWCGVSR